MSTSRRFRCAVTRVHAARMRSSSAVRPTNAVSCARRSAGGGGAAGAAPGLRSDSSSARVSRDGAIASVARSRSAKRFARGERRGTVAGLREALDQAAVRLLAERVQGDLLTREPHRLGGVRRGPCLQLERLREPFGVGLARRVRPLLVEPVEDRHAAGGERPGRIAGGERPLEPAHVDREPVAVERHRVARGHEVRAGGPERAPQLAQRGTQARAGGLAEHVGPKARRERSAGVRAGMEGEVGEHAPYPPGGGERQLDPAGLEPEPAAEPHPHHARNCGGWGEVHASRAGMAVRDGVRSPA